MGKEVSAELKRAIANVENAKRELEKALKELKRIAVFYKIQ